MFERKPIGNPFAFLKGALAKQVKTEELSPDDVIIASVASWRHYCCIYWFSMFPGLWAQLVLGRAQCVFRHIRQRFHWPISVIVHQNCHWIRHRRGAWLGVVHKRDQNCQAVRPRIGQRRRRFRWYSRIWRHKQIRCWYSQNGGWLAESHVCILNLNRMRWFDILLRRYEKEILLSGLLYFHRISDNRMAGTPLKNLRMFGELCGKNSFHSVILVTTMWDEVDEETGNLREAELKSRYWRSMLDRQSTTCRFLQTRESALHLIEPLIDEANAKSSLLLQQELVDMRTKLPATSAGQKLYSEMEDLVKRRQEVLGRIRIAMKQTNENQTSLPLLKQEYQRLKTQLDTTVNEMQKLKLPIGKRLSQMTRKWFSLFRWVCFWSW